MSDQKTPWSPFWDKARRYLLPGKAEQDEGFRQEILGLSHLGLRVIGALIVAVPMFMQLAWFVLPGDLASRNATILHTLSVVMLGVLTLAVARTRWSRAHARLLAALSGFLVAAVLVWGSFALCEQLPAAAAYIPGKLTLVMLVAVAAVPFRPLQTLSLGLSIEGFYLGSAAVARHWQISKGAPADPMQHPFLVALALVCTAMTALVYSQRASHYRTHQQALRASEDLRHAQWQTLLAENAATMGRLAATLSHELNSPLGVLTSAVGTLCSLARKQQAASPAQQQRLREIQAALELSVNDAASRLREIISRMQRFTNMDNAEVQTANLNQLLSDVAALFEPQAKGKVQVALDLQPVPPLVCRPQQLSAVFSNLLGNAIQTVDRNGHVVVSTRMGEAQAEVRIQDDGPGLSAAELATIFEPGFRVSGSRVSGGNWSLFTARQIVHEHGGRISISSSEGDGTTVSIVLPHSIAVVAAPPARVPAHAELAAA